MVAGTGASMMASGIGAPIAARKPVGAALFFWVRLML